MSATVIHTASSPEGLTLQELADFVSSAYATGAKGQDLVKVRIDFSAGVKKIWAHPAGQPYRPFFDGH